MNTLYLMNGISGGGKSTYAKKLSESTGAKIICPDSIRGELSPIGDESDQSNNAAIFTTLVPQRLNQALVRGESVVFDAMNLKAKDRRRYIQLARKSGASIECHFIRPNLITSFRQNRLRTRQVDEGIIADQFRRWQEPRIEEGFDKIVEVK